MKDKFGFIALVVIFFAGILSVYQYIPNLIVGKNAFSPGAMIPLSFMHIAHSMLDMSDSIYSFKKLAVLYFSAGLPVVLLYIIWNICISKKNKIGNSSLGLFAFIVVMNFLIFYNGLVLLKYNPNFYFLMMIFNFLFFLISIFIFYKNRKNSNINYNFAFDFVLFLWLAWCAFPRFSGLINT